MKEIRDILKAYEAAKEAGKQSALATVVKVEGSSYRQPGARMLVTDDGELTGAISGGCLEGDALKKALLAIHQQQNKLVTYDTSDENDAAIGVQLGCNGIVHILFEYIDEDNKDNPIFLLKEIEKERTDSIIITLFSTERKQVQPGTVFFYREGQKKIIDSEDAVLSAAAVEALANKASGVKTVESEYGSYEALIEYLAPPLSLVIAGAGNDVIPVVKAAALLGWDTTVIDGRATHATKQRFPDAKSVLIAKPEAFLENTVIDSGTYVLLMTHNYKYDIEVLKLLLETDCPYIGILGPKTKLERMLDDLNDAGIMVTDEQLGRVYGPVGLDIGAEPSEEIAISIVAEILAVKNGKHGTSLKYKKEKIHNAAEVV
ncbi:MAG: XdhC/CoxI family protein [Flavobacterium sp.]|nr:MAG: XdhC/CoxI family protein [Flavobacterium sp.]